MATSPLTTQTSSTTSATAGPGRAGRRYLARAIDQAVLAGLRAADDAGNPPRLLTDAEGGSPLRCCLRPSVPGERIALVSYAPLRRWARATGADPGPYNEVGPVFIHPASCPGPAGDGLPAALLGGPRVFRAYSARGHILGGRPFGLDAAGPDGTGFDGTGMGGTGIGGSGGPAGAAAALLADIYADPEVAVVHVRAMAFGCFLFEALPGEPAPLPAR